MARFGHPLKASKAPQQLSKAFEPQNPPQQLAKVSRLLCHGTSPEAPQAVSIGLRNCYVARFGHPLKASKAPAAFEGLWTTKPSQQLAKAPRLLCHSTPPEAPQAVSIGLRKLLRGTFWAPLKSFKSPAAAFEGLWTAKPSAAACEGVPPALPWYLPIGPTSCLYWASQLLRGTFWAPLKSLKSPAAAFEGLWTAKPSAAACEGLPPALPWYLPIGPTSCLYWASKLLRGTFWAPLKSLKSPAAAFEGLCAAKPSAAACEGVPPALPWYLSRGPTSCFYQASKLLRGTFWPRLKSLKRPSSFWRPLNHKTITAACEGAPPALP